MADQDRRVRRTRRALHEALIALVLERGYDRLTVQDVLDRADVGRSTFYAHYRDKEALLTAVFDDMRAQLQGEVDARAPDDPLDPARPAELLFEHAHRNQRVYRALCGRRGGEVVLRHLHGMTRELLLGPLRTRRPDLPVEVVAEFHASATVGLLRWWIDQDFPHDPAWLAAIHRALAFPGPAGPSDRL
ncbi:TetR/AcrR family transcriptional regulator [Pseudonocardia humida]|uniref:TetR/AcrR family transcriptional regulator n=1 Tax=Pseudonocardia humida TaxID=2800819 RepID=A0ABT0ZUR9_9PSEU|nr:TetR/AcrR family transcriptional regulator [Pseudonocardia humida]MCO1654481.1 TetR/AcrR family transcriptional regulator [Pseudonocardia humida]